MAAFVGVHVCIHPQETLASATCRVGADRALEGRWKGGFSHACLYRCSKRACVRACVRVLPPPSLLPLAVVQEVCE